MWLDQGYGYCTVNYRGSIGFGKDYERKIYGNPGFWEVEDVVAARAWLIEHADADSNNIIIAGWSWGGYVTLLALGKYPGLWKCGVAGTAIADCVMQYEDSPASFKAFDDEVFGGNPKNNPEVYKKSSPITYAPAFSAPILVIQGENDSRCTPRQMKHFESVLRSFGKNITVKWFSSGHVGEFSNTQTRVSNASASLDFINKQIKNPGATPRD
jgi:dipeptidyl aminopeptidase/acylaminoacyl peptidase